MTHRALTHLTPTAPGATPAALPALVQRACACGGSAGVTGECEECRSAKLAGPAAELRPKLRINEPGDRFEREADRVADTVMRMPAAPEAPEAEEDQEEPVQPKLEDAAPLPVLQRQGAPEAEEDEEAGVEHTPEAVREMEESNVAPKREAGAAGGASGGREVQAALASPGAGRGLDPSDRGLMERRLGHDFSRVRVHTGEPAHRAARSIRARAFTQGPDVWFARGEYAPGTDRGRRLLAHELVHTVQQGASAGPEGAALVQRSVCPSSCETPVSAGRLCRAGSVTRDNCGDKGAADDSNKISHIRVLLDTRRVHLFWNGRPRTDDGTKEELECSPNPSLTPTDWDTVGVKCGVNHTSYARYNMAWFTALKSHGYRYGFHDSQPVGARYNSHGCIRVSCENAQKINQNTVSDWTSIIVRNSAPGD
ncbi:MAG TPA: DUF4157 domain-containing protein [Thermoanaerobaculia bacterium]|nr:DUF4157 domain-containing protein [Thermoanaerobaculia bacterium]